MRSERQEAHLQQLMLGGSAAGQSGSARAGAGR